ncbi:MAG: hypothetical protein AB1941_01130 [Gemmatimonadota bacterium]
MHDLHVWTITSGLIEMSGHMVVEEGFYGPAMQETITGPRLDRFGIEHATIQREPMKFRERRTAA